MKRFLVTLSGILLFNLVADAQSKIFKEVSSEISSQMKAIIQDGVLVGYVVATQLEKASKDSFNYKVTIMDENLNDIGEIRFRELWLKLQDVSLEQDVLSLAYVKSNFFGQKYTKKKEKRTAVANGEVWVFNQFVNLEGKILNTQSIKASVDLSPKGYSIQNTAEGLRHQVQMRNIPGKGFAVFFADERKNTLLTYNVKGEKVWEQGLSDKDAYDFSLLTTNNEVYLLERRKSTFAEGGYELHSFKSTDGKKYPGFKLVDKQGSELKVLGFDNDPATGRPYVSGNVIHSQKGVRKKMIPASKISRGIYTGVFTINFDGPTRKEIKEVYSYWNDGSNPAFSKKGRYNERKLFPALNMAFKDYQGNTFYGGTGLRKRFRYGVAFFSALTLPTLFFPPMLLSSIGTTKYKMSDAMILKQTGKGSLSLENSIEGNKGMMMGRFPAVWMSMLPGAKTFYTVSNSETKSNYLIINDTKKSVIYDVMKRKVIRSIPYVDGKTRMAIFPAKEGHVLVSEYNAKEKYTRYSIEAV